MGVRVTPGYRGAVVSPTPSQLGDWGWGKAGTGTLRLYGGPSLPEVAAFGEAADGYGGGAPRHGRGPLCW